MTGPRSPFENISVVGSQFLRRNAVVSDERFLEPRFGAIEIDLVVRHCVIGNLDRLRMRHINEDGCAGTGLYPYNPLSAENGWGEWVAAAPADAGDVAEGRGAFGRRSRHAGAVGTGSAGADGRGAGRRAEFLGRREGAGRGRAAGGVKDSQRLTSDLLEVLPSVFFIRLTTQLGYGTVLSR